MNTPLKAIIIEDELLAVKRLRRLLENYAGEIEVVAEAFNGEQGLQLVEQNKPGLIFLDIEMPVLNGFEMLNRLKHLPKVIFTTAFEEYAIKAFEENSIDYLLKPIEPERLDKAVQKLKRLGNTDTSLLPEQINAVVNALHVKKEIKSLPVKIGDKILLIKPEQIAFLEAKDKYVFIVTDDNIEYLTDFTLTSIEEKLSRPFMRVHRAYIINCDKIKEFYKGDSGSFIITMKDKKNTRIYSGRSYSENVKSLFEI